MLVESRKSFRYGFILTEPELRRFVDTITEQFCKITPNQKPESVFTMKFKNGVIATTNSLDEVLTQENSGPGQIVKLGANFSLGHKGNKTQVDFEFIDVDFKDEEGYTSVRYFVQGASRDWVFVTSTLIEERMTKVKRWAPNQLLGKGRSDSMIVMFFLSFIMITSIFFIIFTVLREESGQPYSLELEKAWKQGTLKDPIDAFIRVQKNQEEQLSNFGQRFFSEMLWPIGISGGILLLLILFFVLLRYYPVFNFCWGDYIDIFQHKESKRKFIIGIIIIGIIVSFIGGILANLFKGGT